MKRTTPRDDAAVRVRATFDEFLAAVADLMEYEGCFVDVWLQYGRDGQEAAISCLNGVGRCAAYVRDFLPEGGTHD